jgi:hypothetical protein
MFWFIYIYIGFKNMLFSYLSFFYPKRLLRFALINVSIVLSSTPVLAFEDVSAYSPDLVSTNFNAVTVVGKWLSESDGQAMHNPQTSGLTFTGNKIYSVSDASAANHQQRRLHVIDQDTGKLSHKLGPIILSPQILSASCFADYLNGKPDYEALVAIPNTVNQWLLVTEDGTRGTKIKGECFEKFTHNNFTRYPALIVKIELISDSLILTGVRAIEFNPNDKTDKRGLGTNIENDGIEGLAFTRNNRLLLGIEQDANKSPRVFELAYSADLFDTIDTFIRVKDSGLTFPEHMTLVNPINGMDVYYPQANSEGYLIAAARNNDQLWILDLAKQRPTVIVDIDFYAPSNPRCGKNTFHKIRNTALEGVAVHENTLYLINDPWHQRYSANATCVYDKPKYEAFIPLLFELEINPAWFK